MLPRKQPGNGVREDTVYRGAVHCNYPSRACPPGRNAAPLFQMYFGKEILGWEVSNMNSDHGSESLVGPLLINRYKQAPYLNTPTYMLSLKTGNCLPIQLLPSGCSEEAV